MQTPLNPRREEGGEILGSSGVQKSVSEDACKQRCFKVCISAPVLLQLGWSRRVEWGVYKVETNSSLGDEEKHNYVQFSS